ncbi:MAG: 50S ribosomal protein L35 [Bacillota bacterium]
MPKMKTKRSAAKRFKVTGSGKIMRRKNFKSHLATGKTAKRKRAFRQATEVHETDEKRVRVLIPYM